MTRGRNFLDRGPYLNRAEALLGAPSTSFDENHPATRRRMQAIFDYLEDPVPIDAWKAEIGTEARAPRLKHLVHAYAVGNGLVPKKRLPDTLLNAALIDTRERGLALVRGCELLNPRCRSWLRARAHAWRASTRRGSCWAKPVDTGLNSQDLPMPPSDHDAAIAAHPESREVTLVLA